MVGLVELDPPYVLLGHRVERGLRQRYRGFLRVLFFVRDWRRSIDQPHEPLPWRPS